MRPFGEFDFGAQLGFHRGWLFICLRRFAREGRLLDDQWLHPFGEGRQRPLVESTASVARIHEPAVVIDADQDGAEMLPAVARGREAADHDFLLAVRLDFHPGAAARARLVGLAPRLATIPPSLRCFAPANEAPPSPMS